MAWRGLTGRVPAPLYWFCQQAVPIACVDVLPRRTADDKVEYGLIRRWGQRDRQVWALIGGGVHRSETLASALARHLTSTLGSGVTWRPLDPALPSLVWQYFPEARPGHGVDRNKHAIAMTYLVDLEGEPTAAGEALDFRWFSPSDLGTLSEVWPGHDQVIAKLVPRLENEL